MTNDPIVQILIEAAARGRELRRQREAQARQTTQQSDPAGNDQTPTDKTQRYNVDNDAT